MKWPGRFGLKILGQMLLVAVLSALLSTYAFYQVALRFADFSIAQADRVAVASHRASELFRTFFETRTQEFQRRARAIAEQGMPDLDALAGTEGLLRARLFDGERELDTWEADAEQLLQSREAPPIVVALPDEDGNGPPTVLELTFGIPLAMYENSLALREAIESEKELGQVYEHVIPRFLRQYVVLVLMMLAAAPLVGWFFARKVTLRVAQLDEAARRIGAGDLTVRVAPSGKDELAQLGRAFDAMVEELAQARSRLEYLQKVSAWQEVARRLAHEIKNPLTPIQLSVQQLASKYPGDDPAYRALLDTATEILREEITSLRRLIDDFSAFAKLSEVAPSAIDLSRLVSEIVRLQPEWQGIVAVESSPTPVPVMCDRTLFRRVIANLVENAVQAAQGAGKTPEVRIGIAAQGPRAVVTVADNGPGVAEPDRQRIFDPYVTHRPGGTGLGLAIVRKIVIDHGGDVQVAAAPEGGALFTVALPLGLPFGDARIGPSSDEPPASS